MKELRQLFVLSIILSSSSPLLAKPERCLPEFEAIASLNPNVAFQAKTVGDKLATSETNGSATVTTKLEPLKGFELLNIELGEQVHSWSDLTSNLQRYEKLTPQSLNVPPVKKETPPVPFGEFTVDGKLFYYGEVAPSAKQLSHDNTEIFCGREAKSLADAQKMIETYFTEEVQKPANEKHVDLTRHQAIGEGSKESAFSNGTEIFLMARYRARGPAGIILIIDVSDLEILNIPKFRETIGQHSEFDGEQEILSKGGSSPTKIKGAVMFEREKPVRFYSNPNYVSSSNRREFVVPTAHR